jgi:hypothetical protein
MKYLDLLNKNAEETAKSNNVLIAEESSLTLQTAILNCKQRKARLTTDYDCAIRIIPFNPQNLIIIDNKIGLVNREMEQLITIQKDLF